MSPTSQRALRLTIQGWGTCVFQTLYMVAISLVFILGRVHFTNDIDTTIRYQGIGLDAEDAVVVPKDFYDYLRTMEITLLGMPINTTQDRGEFCNVLFTEYCHWGANKGLNASLVATIREQCWSLSSDFAYIDGSNRLLLATQAFQTRRVSIPCSPDVLSFNPYSNYTECMSDTEEDQYFYPTSGPCMNDTEAGIGPIASSRDDCHRFVAFNWNAKSAGFTSSFAEPSLGFPGFSLCRLAEYERLKWIDYKSKKLCYMFGAMNFNTREVISYSNCFLFTLGGQVERQKIILVAPLISDDEFNYIATLSGIGFFLAIFRAVCETLVFAKELSVAGNLNDANFFLGLFRDLYAPRITCLRRRIRIWLEGVAIWFSSSLFAFYFFRHLIISESLRDITLFPEGKKLDSELTLVWGVPTAYGGLPTVADEISGTLNTFETNSGVALIAFLVNSVVYIAAFSFHPRLGVVNKILWRAFSDLAALLIILFVFLVLSALMAFAVFGRAWTQFSSFPVSLQTVASAALGDYDNLLHSSLNLPVSPLIYTLFFVFIWFVRLLGTVLLLNVLISIFSKSYSEKKASESDNRVRLFWSLGVAFYFWFFSWFCSSKSNSQVYGLGVSANVKRSQESQSRRMLNSGSGSASWASRGRRSRTSGFRDLGVEGEQAMKAHNDEMGSKAFPNHAASSGSDDPFPSSEVDQEDEENFSSKTIPN